MRLHNHNRKPPAKFFGDDAYYLGVELECEAPDSEARETGLRPRVQGIYAKRDGSLNCFGWEIVTQPFARKMWLDRKPRNGPVKRFFALLASLRELKYQSHDGGRCGLHVHVCRKAFGQELGSHFYWFARLVNGKLFRKLSQRTDITLDRWAAQIKPEPNRPYGHRGRGRYVAVNVTNRTIEIRIFRGNLREDRVRKAVEAVIAAVEFARTRSSRNWSEDLDLEFSEWVALHRKTYPNLNDYLNEIDRPAQPNPVTEDHAEETLQCA